MLILKSPFWVSVVFLMHAKSHLVNTLSSTTEQEKCPVFFDFCGLYFKYLLLRYSVIFRMTEGSWRITTVGYLCMLTFLSMECA